MAYLLQNPHRARGILTTLRQMLEDRGYVVQLPYAGLAAQCEGDDKVAQTYYDTHEVVMKGKYPEAPPLPQAPTKQGTILVLNSHEEKLAKDTIMRYMAQYGADVQTKVLLVIRDITPAAKQIVQSNKRFAMFYEREVYRNITHHKLYVPHRGLTQPEKEAVLAKYRCRDKNMPSLLRSEPMARYFDFEVGQLVEIGTVPKSWRLVVERAELK